MCTSRTDIDVTTGWLQNQDNFQGVHCNTADFLHYFTTLKAIIYFHTICSVAPHTVNSLEISFILQPARIDVKIGRHVETTVHMEIG